LKLRDQVNPKTLRNIIIEQGSTSIMLSWLSKLLLGFVVLVLLAAELSLVVQSMTVGPDTVTFTVGSTGHGGVGRLETTYIKGTFTVTRVS
jgi:hypothetical protein